MEAREGVWSMTGMVRWRGMAREGRCPQKGSGRIEGTASDLASTSVS